MTLFGDHQTIGKGCVSERCRCSEQGGSRFVLVDEKIVYIYDANDKVAERQISVHLYRCKAASQTELAKALGVSDRTMRNWVKKYREKGIAGLIDKERPGAPVKLTQEVRDQIIRYRKERMKVTEIAQVMNLGFGSVCRVLYASKGRQGELFVDDDSDADEANGENGKDEPGRSVDSPVTASTPGPVDLVRADSCDEVSSTALNETVSEKASNATRVDVDPSDRPTPDSSDAPRDDAIFPEPCTPLSVEASGGNADDIQGEDPADGVPGRPIDPLDRSDDRMWARFGLLEDAKPIFVLPGREEKIEFAGAFLAIALLAKDPYLKVAKTVYKSFGPAFYGIRSMFMTWLLMALLRIKNNEEIRDYNVHKVGRLLGLDRAPEVKTLRRKLHELSLRKEAVTLMEQLADERISQLEQPVASLYVDGHVKSYYGKFSVGKTWSSSLNKVVNASTEYWINLPGGVPLLCVSCQFNDHMPDILPQILADVEKICSQKKPVIIFDRGGYSAELFEKLMADGYDFITYGKNRLGVDQSCFKKEVTQINDKTYEHAPYEQTAGLAVYTEKKGKNGQRYRTKTGRTITLREILILRSDGGQTSILTSLKSDVLEGKDVAEKLFERWTQENFFKYMLREFNLDHLCEYGTVELDDSVDHPNPEYTRLQKQLKKLNERIGQFFGKKADQLTAENMTQAAAELCALKKGKHGERLLEAIRMRKKVTSLLKTTPTRVSAVEFKRLKPEMKLFSNAIKISAYHIESKLVDLLGVYYKDTSRDGRTIIAAALKSSGTLRIEGRHLIVTIENQSSPRRTRLLEGVCSQLNTMKYNYPDCHLKLYFQMQADRIKAK